MSRLFILFLIALLPLRGWTAERMVFQPDQLVSVTAEAVVAAMPADCALHMQSAASAEAGLHDADHAPVHKGCQSCQLCMPLAGHVDPVRLALAFGPQTLPATGSSHFVSADTARDVKPPIS